MSLFLFHHLARYEARKNKCLILSARFFLRSFWLMVWDSIDYSNHLLLASYLLEVVINISIDCEFESLMLHSSLAGMLSGSLGLIY